MTLRTKNNFIALVLQHIPRNRRQIILRPTTERSEGTSGDGGTARVRVIPDLPWSFDFDDLAIQIAQIRKMGGMDGVLSMLPGVAKIRKQIAASQVDERQLNHQEAIIRSMTPAERRNAKLLNSARKRRIAAGSGTTIQEVNRLLKQQKDMTTMMKRAKKMGKRGVMPPGMPGVFPPGFPTP